MNPKLLYSMCLICPSSCVTGCCVSAATSAPLKLKASRGPPTPINRNQASQPRVSQSLLGKRGFDSVSSPHAQTLTFTSCLCCLEPTSQLAWSAVRKMCCEGLGGVCISSSVTYWYPWHPYLCSLDGIYLFKPIPTHQSAERRGWWQAGSHIKSCD